MLKLFSARFGLVSVTLTLNKVPLILKIPIFHMCQIDSIIFLLQQGLYIMWQEVSHA